MVIYYCPASFIMNFLKELEDSLGKNLIIGEEEKVPYRQDASYIKGKDPIAVAIPETIEQISQTVKICQKYSVPIVVRGGGTSLTGSSVPLENFLVISMLKFDKIIEVHPEDRYVVAEAGVRLDTLNDHLLKYGLFYPPDPGSSIAATVGGSISTNAGGLRAVSYGTTKEWVLGLEVVLPNGEVISVGGKVLKRTAGYDLAALLVGSEGTLGIITRAILKVWPIPEARGRILAYYDEIGKVGQAVSSIKAQGITPEIAEFMDRITMDSLERTRGMTFQRDAKYMLIVDVASTKESIKRRLNETAEVLQKFQPLDLMVTTDPNEMAKIYEARKGAYASLLGGRGSSSERVVIGDIVVPASKLPEALREIEAKIGEYGLKVALFGHIADGNIHANIYADVDDEDFMIKVERFQIDLGKIAIKHEGSVSAEHGIGIEKKELLKLEISSQALEIMKGIKKAFDPKNIMNRGKVFD